MSTSTLRVSFSVDGVNYDPSAVWLESPDGEYGIKRLDNNATVVGAGETDGALTKDAIGEYHRTFTDPAAGLTYLGYVREFTEGEVFFDPYVFQAAGIFVSASDLEDIFGIKTIKEWSNLERNQTTRNDARIIKAIQFALSYANTRLAGHGVVVPLQNLAEDDERLLRTAVAKKAAMWLYSPYRIHDGPRTEGDSAYDRTQAEVDDTLDQFGSGMIGSLTRITRTATRPARIQVVRDTCTPWGFRRF